jgi:cellulose biosynthesis protein BcsQ
MRTVAVYNLKGGVGKTTLAVNLAHAAAALSQRRTLLWDLDPQAASSYILTTGEPRALADDAQAIFTKDVKPEKLVQQTGIEGLDLIAADMSLRGLDRLLFDLSGRRRLAKLIERLGDRYDRVILDCPPGLGPIAEHVLRAADVVIVPVIPSPLSERAFAEVAAHLGDTFGKAQRRPPLLPVHSMVDRRRLLHRAALERNPAWPVIPMASVVEAMAAERQPLARFAPRSPAAQAFDGLWIALERRLNTDT